MSSKYLNTLKTLINKFVVSICGTVHTVILLPKVLPGYKLSPVFST